MCNDKMIHCIDTHTHLDGEEFRDDLPAVIQRAKEAGVSKVFLPAVDLQSVGAILRVCREYPHYAYPMVGLHPEEVKDDFHEVLGEMKATYLCHSPKVEDNPFVAIGEVGLDFYWSREYESQQLEAFEEQVKWSVETGLPLMIHCRKAQNEMVKIMRKYADDLPGGVFHCFTGNEIEARELLSFDRFVLGIGGVLTFKKSHLPEVLPSAVPLDRIVLETDSPYMAPVPHRGKRNESAFVVHVMQRLAEAYQVSIETIANSTNDNVARVFGIS